MASMVMIDVLTIGNVYLEIFVHGPASMYIRCIRRQRDDTRTEMLLVL